VPDSHGGYELDRELPGRRALEGNPFILWKYFFSVLEGLRRYLDSVRAAPMVAILLLSSPQSPLTTLRELRASFPFLPDPEELIVDFDRATRGLSAEMRKVLKAAVDAQRSGSTSSLEENLRDALVGLAVALEKADYKISRMYEVVSTFLSTMTAMIVALLAFMGGASPTLVALELTAAAAIVSAALGPAIYPLEYSLPAPPLKSYLPLLSAAPLYLALTLLGAPFPLTLSLALGSLFTGFLHFTYVRLEVGKVLEAREIVRVARRHSWNARRALVAAGLVRSLEDLKRPERSIAFAARLGVYQILLHGGYELLERLEDYYSRLVDFVLRLRSKTRVFLVEAVIEAVIVSMIYGLLVALKPLFAGEYAPLLAVAGVSAAGLEDLSAGIDQVLAATAVALSIATSSAREGKPFFFAVYLPPLALVLLAAFTAAASTLPGLLGLV
jgi:hypothetical protein